VGGSGTRREAAWVAIGSAVFALCFGYPILRDIFHEGIPFFAIQRNGAGVIAHDWDLLMQARWVPAYTMLHYRQFPFWNPYSCGGEPMLGSPFSAFLTPFLPLELAFGPLVGVRLEIVIHIAIAFTGAYFLARVMDISKLGATACAATFAGSSWYYLRMTIGHLGFMPFAYMPWVIAFIYVGARRNQLTPAALGGMLMALMLLMGGLYPFLVTASTIALLASMIGIQRRAVFPVLEVAVIGAFGLGFAAIKLFPGLAYTGVNARLQAPSEVNELRIILMALFSRAQSVGRVLAGTHQGIGFWEYGAYTGPIFVGLGIFGAARQYRRAWPWIVTAMVLLILVAGNFGAYSPWAVLHGLPFYASTHEPERWLIPFTLAAGVLCAFGVDSLRRIAMPWGAWITAFLIAIAVADAWAVDTRELHYVVEGPGLSDSEAGAFRQSANPDLRRAMFSSARANIGVIRCAEDIQTLTPVRGFAQVGYRGEQQLLGPGNVTLERWTPNALTFNVDAAVPTVLVVNQNFDPGWRLVRGNGTVFARGGLLGVLIPAGAQQLELAYQGVQFTLGLAITVMAFAAMLILWKFENRTRVSQA